MLLSAIRYAYIPREVVFSVVKGVQGRQNRCFKLAIRRAMHHLKRSYSGRRSIKWQFRRNIFDFFSVILFLSYGYEHRGFLSILEELLTTRNTSPLPHLCLSHLSLSQPHPHQGRFYITKINAASREWGLPYSRMINGLRRANIYLDRKSLCSLLETEPISFKAVCDEAKRLVYYPKTKVQDLRQF